METADLRDNSWLEERLATLWYKHFADITQPNEVVIRFGRKSATRLGSITRMPGSDTPSIITLTGHFKDVRVPDYVVDSTIAHELVHYCHGFHSPHPQKYRYPHQGGIVDKEMIDRGLSDTLKKQRIWLKQEWQEVVGVRRRRTRKRTVRLRFWPAF